MERKTNDGPSPETLRRDILAEMLAEVAFEGWTDTALDEAADAAGMGAEAIGRGDLGLLFPKGVPDVLAFWAAEEDAAMAARYSALEDGPTRIRDKITWLVRDRIDALSPHREAARRAAAVMALPLYPGLGPRLAWRTAGAMWMALGDRSTDGNFYSKRATLSAVYLSTLTRWFADDASDGEYEASWTFLDRRIDGVMQFEKFKAQATKASPDFNAMFGWLGRQRYGTNGQ